MVTLSTGKIDIFMPASLPSGVGRGVERGRPSGATNAHPALTRNAVVERIMHLTRITPGVRPAQEFIDPIITQARLINEAADIERRLAIRRALRPQRSDAARRGWEKRNG